MWPCVVAVCDRSHSPPMPARYADAKARTPGKAGGVTMTRWKKFAGTLASLMLASGSPGPFLGLAGESEVAALSTK